MSAPGSAIAGPVPTELDAEELAAVLDVVFRAGRLLAGAGAAAFRVRGVMHRVAEAFDVRGLDLVVTTDSLAATLRSGAQFRTRVLRLGSVGVDMNRICRLELLSRRLEPVPRERLAEGLAELGGALDELEAAPRQYPLWVTGPLLGLACAAFCLAMKGTPGQAVATLLGTTAGHLLRLWHHRGGAHPPVPTVVVSSAFVAALGSLVAARGAALVAPALGLTLPDGYFAPGKAVVASVLFLVPGVPLVNALLDLLHFDLTAGLGRGAFAAVVLVCIAVGVLAFLSLTGFPLT
jgi:uncharacterized membrane protein YjjP (DUF1212 family)